MLFITVIVFNVVSAASFVWGYQLAGYESFARWLFAFGLLGAGAAVFKWKWFFAPAMLAALALAVFGVWFKLGGGWMFNGAMFALLAWTVNEFEQKLKMLPAREDKAGMTRRHLLRVGFLAVVTFLISMMLGF